MQLTIFLAKLIGLTMIIVSLYTLAQKRTVIALIKAMIDDRPLMFFIELVGMIAGLAMVLAHNIWSGTLAIVVTLIGWMLLIRSLVWMVLPPRTMRQLISALRLERNYPVFAGLSLLIGAYLTYQGFVR